jgi:hypothetical protein
MVSVWLAPVFFAALARVRIQANEKGVVAPE